MPTTFVLMRHAEGTHNVDFFNIGGKEQWTHPIYIDAELTENGIKQAAEAEETLKPYVFEAIYCSPLRRARATLLDAYPEAQNLPVIVDDRAIEQPQGSNSCDKRLEREMVIADCPPNWNTDNINVENPFFQEYDKSLEHLQSFTEDIQKAHPDGTVLVVAHGTWIHNWLLTFRGLNRHMLNNCEFVVVTLPVPT